MMACLGRKKRHTGDAMPKHEEENVVDASG